VDDVEPPTEEGGDVLHENEARSKYPNGLGDAGPQAGVDAADAGALTGVGDVLITPNSG
jgi:hypothetical protein